VLEKSLAVGLGGVVSNNVRTSLSGKPTPVNTVIAGLGGRPITKQSLARVSVDADEGRLEALTFLDLDRGAVERVLARERQVRRSGPITERLLLEMKSR
jgi:pyruvate ferredoxin oxidoreductase alpha subunit